MYHRYENLQVQVLDISNDTLKLNTDVDDLSALLLVAVARCEGLVLDVADTEKSIDLMRKEKARVSTESVRLRNESQAVHLLSLPLSIPEFWVPSRPDFDPSVFNTSIASGSNKENDQSRLSNTNTQLTISYNDTDSGKDWGQDKGKMRENGRESSQEKGSGKEREWERDSVHDSAIEERVALMQHIENLYQHAVQTQSSSKREQQTIKSRAKAAAIECARSKAEVADLDERILDLEKRRAVSEEALRVYTGSESLREIQTRMTATVDFHENVIRDMEADKKHLLLLFHNAVETEETLRLEISSMRDSILEYHRNKIKVKLVQTTYWRPHCISLSLSLSLTHTLDLSPSL